MQIWVKTLDDPKMKTYDVMPSDYVQNIKYRINAGRLPCNRGAMALCRQWRAALAPTGAVAMSADVAVSMAIKARK